MEIDAIKTVKVNARTLQINAKVRDSGFYSLYDADGQQLCDREGCYVPEFLPGNGGDYLELTIDIDTGRITNWKVPTARQIEAWIAEGNE